MRRLALTLISMTSLSATAADWTQFRGANGSAVSSEKNLPTGFNESTGLRWKAELPGRGVSSPVISGNRVYITCSTGQKDDQLHVLAFDLATGKQLWHRQLLGTGDTHCHPDTCMAAPTPVADKSGVYALFATGDLAAFDPDGNLRWYRSLVGDYPTVSNQVGMAASPVLAKGKLLLPMDNVGDSFIAAIDTTTGKNLWKTSRPRDISWTTPLTRTVGDKVEIIYPGARETVAYDVDSGSKVWSVKTGGGSIPSPTIVDDLFILGAGGVAVYRLGADGPKELWQSPKFRTGHSSPLVYDGRIYAANPAGIVVCADAKTGKVIWQERVGKKPFAASPVAGDGKIYLFGEDGILTAIKAGDSLEILGEYPTKERGQATPAIADGAIFVRGEKTLFCVGAK